LQVIFLVCVSVGRGLGYGSDTFFSQVAYYISYSFDVLNNGSVGSITSQHRYSLITPNLRYAA